MQLEHAYSDLAELCSQARELETDFGLWCAAAAIAGAATIYPGWDYIDWGTCSHVQPYLSGLGPVYLSWLVVPLLALVFVASIFLPMRSRLFRAEDPFYTVLWVSSHSIDPFSLTLCVLGQLTAGQPHTLPQHALSATASQPCLNWDVHIN